MQGTVGTRCLAWDDGVTNLTRAVLHVQKVFDSGTEGSEGGHM